MYLLAPDGKPRLPRRVKDIDVAVPRGSGRPAARLLEKAGYVGDQMFNALHGSRRLLFIDPAHERHLDVFVGEFSMCHEIPLTARLDRAPLTVPPEELLLSKLQIVEATANDQSDLYSLLVQYEVGPGADLDASFVAALCAKDWGLWRTCVGSIERLRANLESSPLDPGEASLVQARLEALRGYLEAAAEDHEVAAAQPGRRQGALVPAAGRGAGPGGWDPAMSASRPWAWSCPSAWSCPEAGDVR